VLLGRAGDDQAALRAAIERGRDCDVLCITGGVSMGEFDFVPEVLASLGARLLIRKISIKPGRPVHVARWADGGMVFALPGNPISALVGFELLVRPALALLEGRTEFARPMLARLSGWMEANRARRAYVPARAWVDDGGRWWVEPVSWQGSGDPFGMATANALIVRSPHADVATGEDEVTILRLG
jgi:molybdopterin molybdotransferase